MNNIRDLGIKSNRIQAHKECEKEIAEIYNNISNKSCFKRQFKERLKWLEEETVLFRNKTDWFGKLVSNKKFDKMKFLKTEHNTRIVFYVTNDIQPTILLYAFKEKSGNKGASIEYTKASEIAEKRLKEVTINGKIK